MDTYRLVGMGQARGVAGQDRAQEQEQEGLVDQDQDREREEEEEEERPAPIRHSFQPYMEVLALQVVVFLVVALVTVLVSRGLGGA